MFKAYLVIGPCTDFKIMHLTHPNTNTRSEKPPTDPHAIAPASPLTTRVSGSDRGAPRQSEGERGGRRAEEGTGAGVH